jgi:hypothetical protein
MIGMEKRKWTLSEKMPHSEEEVLGKWKFFDEALVCNQRDRG